MRSVKHGTTLASIVISMLMLSGCGSSGDVIVNDQATSEPASDEMLMSEENSNDKTELLDGYYGYLSDDGTKYSLGINIEGFHDYYCLSVLPKGGGGTVVEGTLEKNTDENYKAKVNVDNSEILTGKYFEIRPVENGAMVFSEDADFNVIVGTYPFVSEDWDTLENILNVSENDAYSATNTESNGDTAVAEFVTEDELGGELAVYDNGDNYRFKLMLYRLTEIEGTAEENENSSEMLDFTGIDAAGNPIRGTIEQVEGGGCVLTITDTTWEYLENGKTFIFTRKVSYLSDNYIYKDSDSCVMTEGDVEVARKNLLENLPDGKTIEQMIINEIYARHGYTFKNPSIQAFFDGKSWYQGTTDDMDGIYEKLNDFEKKNIEFLQK